jgi:DNA-binding NarL/FixJ family response regulator
MNADATRREPVTRLLLVDDHPVFLDGLARLLAAEPWTDVVATARDVAEATVAARSTRPAVAVVDLQLPDGDGVELTKRLLEHDPKVRILLLTMHAGQDTVLRALAAGAAGYVLKDAEPEDIVAAVRQVARGGLVVGAGAAAAVVHDRIADGGDELPALTDRDRELLALLAQGKSTAAIAAELHLAPKTIRNRLSELFTTLGVSGRSEAIVLARSAGLGHR